MKNEYDIYLLERLHKNFFYYNYPKAILENENYYKVDALNFFMVVSGLCYICTEKSNSSHFIKINNKKAISFDLYTKEWE